MSTQDKKIKVVSTADFDNNKIINATIDASENEVIGVGEITDVLVNGESVVENKIADVEVPTKLSELENDCDYATQNDVAIVTTSASAQIDSELNSMSFNAVTNKAVTNGINNTKINFINDMVSTLPEATTLGQSILNTSNNKIYTSIYEKIIDPLYDVTGTINIDNEGTITGFTNDNYITFESGWWHYLFPLRLQMNLDGVGSYYYDVDIPTFTISRSDDNSVLFEMRLKCTNMGNQAQIIFTTYKRDGTVVESSDVKFTAVRNMYNSSDIFTLDMSTVNSSYYDASGISITLTQNGKSIFNKIFKSLVSAGDPESDFYYDLGGFVKIINERVSSPYGSGFKGIRKIYGFNSYISAGSYSPASKNKFASNTNTIIWDDGVALETNKLLCDTTTNILYRYNGTILEEITPNLDNYQKKLTAGDNITISGEGFVNFSSTNYLEFINDVIEPTPNVARDFIIKFRLDEINRNNTLIYSTYDTNKYCLLEINNENKLICTYMDYSGNFRTEIGTHVFQANKEYWIMVTTDYYPQFIYFLEDNGYTIDSLPTDISAWTFDIESSSFDYMMVANVESPVYLGYNSDATNNFLKGAIGECRIKDINGNIIFTLSEAVESETFINHGCLKGPVISAIAPEIDSQLSDVSENAVQNKVIDAALKAMKPVIVTDSGTTLPSASGYQLNDTFLNTTDKKVYKAEMTIEGYELNTDVTNEGITVDLQTGVASGFLPAGVHGYMPIGIMRSNVNILWKSPVTIDFHFKITETRNTQVIATFYQGDGDYKCVIFYIENDNKLYCTYTQGSYGPGTQSGIYLLADYQLSLNTEYFVRIYKNGTNVTTTISTQGYNISSVYEETINDVIDWYPSLNYSRIIYGYYNSGPLNSGQSVFSGDIYLADSVGDFLIPTGSLSWDSGTSILNSTGYIDKTNSILHYYESPDLISVGGGSGSSYVAGAGIDEEELAENNKIAVKQNVGFRNLVFVFPMSSVPSNKVTINQTTFATYTGNNDNNFYSFDYDGSNWKLNNNTIDLNDYGITIDSSYVASDGDSLVIAGNFFAGKTEFEIIMLEFNNVFLNGILLFPDVDYTLEETQDGIKIKFIDYTLKATDRIQVL